jgi:hypothetical protein
MKPSDTISEATAEAIATDAAMREATDRLEADPYAMLVDARAHLHTALVQSCSADDQIIIGHVREALALLNHIKVSR